MLLSCIIVDDEPLAVRLLESYVEKTPDLQLVASFTDSITAINAIKAQKPRRWIATTVSISARKSFTSQTAIYRLSVSFSKHGQYKRQKNRKRYNYE